MKLSLCKYTVILSFFVPNICSLFYSWSNISKDVGKYGGYIIYIFTFSTIFQPDLL